MAIRVCIAGATGRAVTGAILACAKQRQAHRIWMYATRDGQAISERAGFVAKRRHTLEMELLW